MVGVYVMLTGQVELEPTPGTKVHGDPEKVPVPVLANATVPVGAVGLVLFVSTTMTVQLVALFATTVAG